ncbi:MAG: alanine dehydrogenase [Anaerolineae bacterium SM23_84]|nr:MAG: alanine dehydrogenase [Anaerolineae bacterium SM23_84]
MIIGILKEIKDNEYRVSVTPGGAHQLVEEGHQVLLENGAGEGSGFADQEYAEEGVKVIPDAAQVWRRAEMIMKVKEPLAQEYDYLRNGLILYTYLHLAANEELTRQLLARQITGIAYETVEMPDGSLPLLTPMSEVAGKMAVQIAAHCLERMNGGRGKLLGGIPGVLPADVVIIGGGVVGTNAALVALGMGANVIILDINPERLRYLSEVLRGNLNTLISTPRNIAEAVRRADVVIGAVLVKGAKAPRLVTREMVAEMKPGSVIVDVAVDQGGCVETTRPTSHSQPTYLVDGVVHYGVPNIPGAVPRTSTYGLSNVTLPYALKLASKGFLKALEDDPALAKGVNTYAGHVTYKAVAEAFDMEYRPLAELV